VDKTNYRKWNLTKNQTRIERFNGLTNKLKMDYFGGQNKLRKTMIAGRDAGMTIVI
jgi:hypothetical protein